MRASAEDLANGGTHRDSGVGAGPWGGVPPEQYPHFLQLVGILRRRVRLVLAVAAIGTLLVAGIGVLIPPKYTAKAQLLVEPQTSPANGDGATASAADEPAIDTQVTLLTSHDHLQRVVESLSRDATLRGAAPKSAGEASTPKEAAAQDAPSGPVAPEAAAAPQPAGGPTLDDLDHHLRVAQERSSRVIGVSYVSASASQAALIANRVVQLFVENQRRQKQEYASREVAQLDDRVAELKKEIEESRAAMQALLQQRPGLGQLGAGDARAAQIRELEQETAARNQLYDSLLRRQKELRYRQAVVAPDVRILSLASPPDRPSSSSPLLFILPASIIFSMAGCFLAVVRERLDRGIRSPSEIGEALGLPCMGLVPQLPRRGRLRMYKYLLKHPFSPYTEAIRSLVAALQLTSPDPPAKVILASSSLPGEGKTTLAVSAAIYMALLRRRVLLIDLDFRRPATSRALGAKARRGVADVLLNDLPPEEVIQRIPRLGLDYLPMTRCTVDPVMLFADGRLPRMLERLREAYDCIIIDGPPLLGITEARLLAELADQVLFLVRWGSTPQEVAQSAVGLLRSAGCFDKKRATPPCAVLTQVDLSKHAQYHYGDVAGYYGSDTKRYGRSITYQPYKLEKPKDLDDVIVPAEAEPSKQELPQA